MCVCDFFVGTKNIYSDKHWTMRTSKLWKNSIQPISGNKTDFFCLIDYYFSRIISLNAQRHLKEDLLIISRYFKFFSSSFSLLLSLFQLSFLKKHHVYNLYWISYTLSFCYVVYYVLSEICIGRRFLDDCFYCYSE